MTVGELKINVLTELQLLTVVMFNQRPTYTGAGAECDSAPESSERALEIVLTIAKIYWKNEKNRPSPPKKKSD